MLKSNETQRNKSFVERPVVFFDSSTATQFSSMLRALMAKYSGFRLLEEHPSPGFTQKSAQIYFFGSEQVFWSPSMTNNPLFLCNKLEAVVEHCFKIPKDNQYNIFTNISLVAHSEKNDRDPLIHQKFIGFQFNIFNASALDMLILDGDLEKIETFLIENREKLKTRLISISEQRIQIVSTICDESMLKIFIFDAVEKMYVANSISPRYLEPVTTNISTLDLAILARKNRPEVYRLLITELVLALNTDPKVIEQFAVLLKTKQSVFDMLRTTSNLMQYLKDILKLAADRNGPEKVEMWVENVRLADYLPETDKKPFKEYLSSTLVSDDLEKQLSPKLKRVL